MQEYFLLSILNKKTDFVSVVKCRQRTWLELFILKLTVSKKLSLFKEAKSCNNLVLLYNLFCSFYCITCHTLLKVEIYRKAQNLGKTKYISLSMKYLQKCFCLKNLFLIYLELSTKNFFYQKIIPLPFVLPDWCSSLLIYSLHLS